MRAYRIQKHTQTHRHTNSVCVCSRQHPGHPQCRRHTHPNHYGARTSEKRENAHTKMNEWQWLSRIHSPPPTFHPTPLNIMPSTHVWYTLARIRVAAHSNILYTNPNNPPPPCAQRERWWLLCAGRPHITHIRTRQMTTRPGQAHTHANAHTHTYRAIIRLLLICEMFAIRFLCIKASGPYLIVDDRAHISCEGFPRRMYTQKHNNARADLCTTKPMARTAHSTHPTCL